MRLFLAILLFSAFMSGCSGKGSYISVPILKVLDRPKPILFKVKKCDGEYMIENASDAKNFMLTIRKQNDFYRKEIEAYNLLFGGKEWK